MKEPLVRRKHKARTNQSLPYPSEAPLVDSSIEVLFCTLNKDAVQKASTSYGEKVVTTQLLYKPGLLAVVRLIFAGSRWNLHHERDLLKVITFPEMAGAGEWENSLMTEWDNRKAGSSPEDGCLFMIDPNFDFSSQRFEALQEELIQHLIARESLQFQYNPYVKLSRGFDEPEEIFHARCMEKMRDLFGEEMRTQGESFHMQKGRLKGKLERRVREQTEEGIEELAVFNERQLSEIKDELASLEKQKEDGLKQFEEKLADLSRQQETDYLRLNRGNIQILRFALVWLPYTEFVIQEDDRRRMEVVQTF